MQHGEVVGACKSNAIAGCMVCKRPVCLAHAFVDGFGEAVCYVCVTQAVTGAHADPAEQQSPPAPKRKAAPTELVWARKVLRLRRNATLEDARQAHRRLSAKHHPDRFPEAEKKDAQRRFVDVQRAWELMQTWFSEQAA